MKHTCETLMLSAALRPVAMELRAKACKAAKEAADLAFKSFEAPAGATNEQLEEASRQTDERSAKGKNFEKDWLTQHPVTEFAAAALAELEAIADAIS